MTIDEIRPYQDTTVTLRLSDGETSVVKVLFVDTEYEDFIVDILQTDRPENYKDRNATYVIQARQVLRIEQVSA